MLTEILKEVGALIAKTPTEMLFLLAVLAAFVFSDAIRWVMKYTGDTVVVFVGFIVLLAAVLGGLPLSANLPQIH